MYVYLKHPHVIPLQSRMVNGGMRYHGKSVRYQLAHRLSGLGAVPQTAHSPLAVTRPIVLIHAIKKSPIPKLMTRIIVHIRIWKIVSMKSA
jgi:hypothetical protein